jgi:hypothetical protein
MLSQTLKPTNITAIVRSAGERTEAACYELVAQQIPQENIVIIREVPFATAVAKTFEVGIERGLPWTLCIDADVLLRENAILDLLKIAEQAEENVFEIQASVLCKFFGGHRPAGNHLYRTSLLEKGLSCVADASFIRPETETINRMKEQGHPFIEVGMIVGLHDYEQFYKDIYRKCFIQARKHGELCHKLFQPMWSRFVAEDPDFEVALWGLKDGQTFTGEVQIDVQRFPEQINGRLSQRGWQEKESLSTTNYLNENISNIINHFVPAPEFALVYPQRVAVSATKNIGNRARIKSLYRRFQKLFSA